MPQLSMEFTMRTAIYHCFPGHFCWLRLQHILLRDYLQVRLMNVQKSNFSETRDLHSSVRSLFEMHEMEKQI